MLASELRKEISALIKREVVPAIGCTEPIAVALAVAKASRLLEDHPAKISVGLSGNILKNAMGVGIPGTGMIGLPIAIALGALKGKPELELEVLRDINDEDVHLAKSYLEESNINIYHIDETPSNLYIDAKVWSADGKCVRTIICERHANFIYIEKNGVVLTDKRNDLSKDKDSDTEESIELSLAKVWEFGVESPLSELKFILEAKKLNEDAAHYSITKKEVGHKVGVTVLENMGRHFGDSVLAKMIGLTSAACDARMSGEKIAVMSNSGSGNQGIAITLPVTSFAKEKNASEEMTTRALMLAHLTSIYIKQKLGRLSALCGCVVASTGVSVALVYLMGGSFNQAAYSVKNMIATLTGMICDGAKPACSLKIASGINTAYLSALMAINNHCVTENEGIVSESVDDTIINFSKIGREGMLETDKMVLEIMSGSRN